MGNPRNSRPTGDPRSSNLARSSRIVHKLVPNSTVLGRLPTNMNITREARVPNPRCAHNTTTKHKPVLPSLSMLPILLAATDLILVPCMVSGLLLMFPWRCLVCSRRIGCPRRLLIKLDSRLRRSILPTRHRARHLDPLRRHMDLLGQIH